MESGGTVLDDRAPRSPLESAGEFTVTLAEGCREEQALSWTGYKTLKCTPFSAICSKSLKKAYFFTLRNSAFRNSSGGGGAIKKMWPKVYKPETQLINDGRKPEITWISNRKGVMKHSMERPS